MASKKASAVFAGERADRVGKRRRGERAGGDDDAVPVRRRLEDFLAADVDQRLALDRRGDRGGKALAVDGERSAGRQLVGVGRAHHQRTEPPHLGMQKPDGASFRVVGAERVRTNQLGELSGLVHGGRANRPHFVQHHGHAAARDLPGGLGTGKAAADDMDGLQVSGPQRVHHVAKLGASRHRHNASECGGNCPSQRQLAANGASAIAGVPHAANSKLEATAMSVDAETVRRVAHLARIAVAEDEVEHLRASSTPCWPSSSSSRRSMSRASSR